MTKLGPAFVKLAVPDDLVKSLRGSRESSDLVLLVRVPGEVGERGSLEEIPDADAQLVDGAPNRADGFDVAAAGLVGAQRLAAREGGVSLEGGDDV